jgi:hypothetical protein
LGSDLNDTGRNQSFGDDFVRASLNTSIAFSGYDNLNLKIPGSSGLIKNQYGSLDYAGVNSWSFYESTTQIVGSEESESFFFWANSSGNLRRDQKISGGGGNDTFILKGLDASDLVITISDYNYGDRIFFDIDLNSAGVKKSLNYDSKTSLTTIAVDFTEHKANWDYTDKNPLLHTIKLVGQFDYLHAEQQGLTAYKFSDLTSPGSPAVSSVSSQSKLAYEGSKIKFLVQVQNSTAGDLVGFQISGLSSDDLAQLKLRSSLTLDSTGSGSLEFVLPPNGIKDVGRSLDFTVEVLPDFEFIHPVGTTGNN